MFEKYFDERSLSTSEVARFVRSINKKVRAQVVFPDEIVNINEEVTGVISNVERILNGDGDPEEKIAAAYENLNEDFVKTIMARYEEFYRKSDGERVESLKPGSRFEQYIVEMITSRVVDIREIAKTFKSSCELMSRVSSCDSDVQDAFWFSFPPVDLNCLGGTGSRMKEMKDMLDDLGSDRIFIDTYRSTIREMVAVSSPYINKGNETHIDPYLQIALGIATKEEVLSFDSESLTPEYEMPLPMLADIYEEFPRLYQTRLRAVLSSDNELSKAINAQIDDQIKIVTDSTKKGNLFEKRFTIDDLADPEVNTALAAFSEEFNGLNIYQVFGSGEDMLYEDGADDGYFQFDRKRLLAQVLEKRKEDLLSRVGDLFGSGTVDHHDDERLGGGSAADPSTATFAEESSVELMPLSQRVYYEEIIEEVKGKLLSVDLTKNMEGIEILGIMAKRGLGELSGSVLDIYDDRLVAIKMHQLSGLGLLDDAYKSKVRDIKGKVLSLKSKSAVKGFPTSMYHHEKFFSSSVTKVVRDIKEKGKIGYHFRHLVYPLIHRGDRIAIIDRIMRELSIEGHKDQDGKGLLDELLLHAAQYGHEDVIDYIVDKGYLAKCARDIIKKAFQGSVIFNHRGVMEKIIEHVSKEELNEVLQNENEVLQHENVTSLRSVLSYACFRGDYAMAKLLVEKGCQIGSDSLLYTLTQSKSSSLLQLLLQGSGGVILKEQKVQVNYNAMESILMLGSKEMITTSIDFVSDITDHEELKSALLKKIILATSSVGNVDILKEVIEKFGYEYCKLNNELEDGKTALGIAFAKNNATVLKYLKENDVGNFGDLRLEEVYERYFSEVEEGRDNDLFYKAMNVAMGKSVDDSVLFLSGSYYSNSKGFHAINHIIKFKEGISDEGKKLITKIVELQDGIKTESAWGKGRTLLGIAARSGNINNVEFILSLGFPLTVEGEVIDDPVIEAVKGGNKDICDLLIDKGSRLEVALHQSLVMGNVEFIEHFAHKVQDVPVASLNKEIFRGGERTVIRSAIISGNHNAIEALLGVEGIDINKGSPIIEAANNNNWPIVERLIEMGADLNARDRSGKSLMDKLLQKHHSATGNSRSIVELIEKVVRKSEENSTVDLEVSKEVVQQYAQEELEMNQGLRERRPSAAISGSTVMKLQNLCGTRFVP